MQRIRLSIPRARIDSARCFSSVSADELRLMMSTRRTASRGMAGWAASSFIRERIPFWPDRAIPAAERCTNPPRWRPPERERRRMIEAVRRGKGRARLPIPWFACSIDPGLDWIDEYNSAGDSMERPFFEPLAALRPGDSGAPPPRDRAIFLSARFQMGELAHRIDVPPDPPFAPLPGASPPAACGSGPAPRAGWLRSGYRVFVGFSRIGSFLGPHFGLRAMALSRFR